MDAVAEHFARHIANKKLPSKGDIQQVLLTEPALRNRTWTNVKDFVRSKYLVMFAQFLFSGKTCEVIVRVLTAGETFSKCFSQNQL